MSVDFDVIIVDTHIILFINNNKGLRTDGPPSSKNISMFVLYIDFHQIYILYEKKKSKIFLL